MNSMTGYGRGQAICGKAKVVVEAQSINKKQAEIILNIPSRLSGVEAELRALFDQSIHRGRIVVNISAEGIEKHQEPVLNHELAKAYLKSFRQLQKDLKLTGEVAIETILRSPGVIETPIERTLDPQTQEAVHQAAQIALKQLLLMRSKEGLHLAKDLERRIKTIRAALSKIRKLQPRASSRYRDQLHERIQKLGLQIAIDDERLVKEIALFAERSDFSEELTRLESHLKQFSETCTKTDSIGRTLEFLCQEIARELNTLGAKANDAEISQIAVSCKSELEKIREQTQNVE
jgi:uncharacterized protein (TIGR00255 family)